MEIHCDQSHEIDDLINKYFNICSGQLIIKNKNIYYFNKKRKIAFKLKFIKRLKEFKVIPPNLTSIFVKLYIYINTKKYCKVCLPESTYNPDLIDLGPFFNTRGVQVKLYNFTKKSVLCYTLNYINIDYFDTELYIYSKYSFLKSIPKLYKKISAGIYEREFVDGFTNKKMNVWNTSHIIFNTRYNNHSNQHLIQFIDAIKDLMIVYKNELIDNVLTSIFLENILDTIKDDLSYDILKKCIDYTNKLDNELLIVKAHGDFALKNIVFSKEVAFIIDWERFSTFSIFYDVGNFIFNCNRTGNPNIHQLTFQSDYTLNFVSIIEQTFGIQIGNKMLCYYVLFMIERLSFEKKLYSHNISRYRNFLKIWNEHFNTLLN